MADKVIVLKDPFTGDRLFPVCSSKSIIDESGNPFDLSKYLTQETASTLYAAKTHTHEIANITGLQTELNSLKTSVSEGKSLIAAAVTDKGVQTAADATFQQMATNIGNIQTGHQVYAIEAINCTTSSLQWNNPTGKTSFNDLIIYGWTYMENDGPTHIWGDLYPSSSSTGYNAWNWTINTSYINVRLDRGQGDFNNNSNSLHKLILVVK